MDGLEQPDQVSYRSKFLWKWFNIYHVSITRQVRKVDLAHTLELWVTEHTQTTHQKVSQTSWQYSGVLEKSQQKIWFMIILDNGQEQHYQCH